MMSLRSEVKSKVGQVLKELQVPTSALSESRRDEIYTTLESLVSAQSLLSRVKKGNSPGTRSDEIDRVRAISSALTWLTSKEIEGLTLGSPKNLGRTLFALGAFASIVLDQLKVVHHRYSFLKENGFHANYQAALSVNQGRVTFDISPSEHPGPMTYKGMLSDASSLCASKGVLGPEGPCRGNGYVNTYLSDSRLEELEPKSFEFRLFKKPDGSIVRETDCRDCDIEPYQVALVMDLYVALTGHSLTNGKLVTTNSGMILAEADNRARAFGSKAAYIGVCKPDDPRIKGGNLVAV